MEIKDFFSCLFEEDEGICLSTNPQGTTVHTVAFYRYPEKYSFISINPLHMGKDLNPTEEYHKADKGRRADINVSSYRNLLIEMDKMELPAQLEHMRTIELPYSTCVFSGGKSYHWIISLKTPVSTRTEYNRLVSRVYSAVGRDLVDHACKNPSRFSRVPGHIRLDKNRIQDLIAVNGRVDNERLENWLLSRGIPKVDQAQELEDITYMKPRAKRQISSLSGATKNFLQVGAYLDAGWNIQLFKAAADLCRNGWDIEEASEMLNKITGHLDIADVKTIRSAFNNELNKMEEYNGKKT